jgi:hypothetical protein
MHDIKGNGILEEWNSGRMGFSKKTFITHHSIIPPFH